MNSQNWWFHLYTIRSLKRLALFLSLILGADLLLAAVNLQYFLSVFILGLLISNKIPLLESLFSFPKNFLFHLNNVKLKDLNRFMCLDALICQFAFILGFVLWFMLSNAFNGFGSSSIFSLALVPVFSTPLLLFIVAYWGIYMKSTLDPRLLQKKLPFEYGYFDVVLVILFTAFSFLFFQNEEIAYTIMISCLMMSTISQIRKTLRLETSKKQKTLAALLCIVCLFSFKLPFSYYASVIVNDKSHHSELRAMNFGQMGIFSKVSDVETFIAIEPYLDAWELKNLYSYDIDSSSLSPSHFLNEKQYYRLAFYLKYGRPSPEFLLRLYDSFETDKLYWKEGEASLENKFLALQAWPSDVELPEKYVTLKLELKDKEIVKRDIAAAKED